MSELVESLMKALQEHAAHSRGFLSDAMARALAQVAIETIQQSGSRASSGSMTSPGTGEGIWEPTGDLRWYAGQIDEPVQLQQAWRRAEDGQVRWQAVPLVIEQQAQEQVETSPEP